MFLRLGTLVSYYMQAQDQVQQDNPTLPIDRYQILYEPIWTLNPRPRSPLLTPLFTPKISHPYFLTTFENRFRCEEKSWPPFVQPIEDEVTGYRGSRKRLRKEIEKLGRNIRYRLLCGIFIQETTVELYSLLEHSYQEGQML